MLLILIHFLYIFLFEISILLKPYGINYISLCLCFNTLLISSFESYTQVYAYISYNSCYSETLCYFSDIKNVHNVV